MLTQQQVDEIARRLYDAEVSRRQIPQIVQVHSSLSMDEAYAIQLALIRLRHGEDRVLVGKKVALTNPAVQRALNVDTPVFGHLMSDMVVREGEPISCAGLTQPKIEPEIAFVMRSDLAGPGVTAAHVLAATAGVMPALEIPAARILDWKFAAPDIAADNAFASRVVLGGVITPVDGLDLRLLGVVLERNGQVLSTGAGAAVMGNPVDVVAWLANKLGEYDLRIKAGDVVLPGAMVVAPDVHPGEFYKATFDRLGSVTALFVE
ncbi:MAG: 2-keto-4-pentenoate hydratase [Sphingomonadaceae bacterium]